MIVTGCGDTASIDVLEVNSSLEGKNSVTIVGKIIPTDGMLSISYVGECGKSYYHDIQTVDGLFTQIVDTTFIRQVDFLLSTSNGLEDSKTVRLMHSPKLSKMDKRECDYLKRDGEYENRSTVYVAEESCYDLGYKYGSCVSRQHLNIDCKAGTDVSIPFRCRDRLDTKEGIEAGRI
jgi:hypothetical protein